jgi:catechol 2,3-dioxygenase-like lactoylglutathione lyase family enzyme
MAISVGDPDKARAYYRDFLGFSEPFSLTNPNGSVGLAFIKVNDYQYIEVSPGLKPGDDRLKHIAFYTNDAERMRAYLASRGVAVPDSVPKGRSGNSNFNIKDPDGHTVEIVEYLPDSWHMRNQGKAMSDARISGRIAHVGILVGDAKAAVRFYGDILISGDVARQLHGNGPILDQHARPRRQRRYRIRALQGPAAARPARLGAPFVPGSRERFHRSRNSAGQAVRQDLSASHELAALRQKQA